MSEETNVATEETTNSTESATETTVVTENVSEDAQTPQKSSEAKYRDSLTALRQERQKRRQKDSEIEELKKRIETLENVGSDEDEEEQPPQRRQSRQTRSDALAELAIKIAKDPGFKDRLDLVEEQMASGKTLEEADNAVLADIARKMMTSSESKPSTPPQTLNPIAAQEPSRPKPTGNILKDIVSGKVNVPPELRNALRNVLPQ